MLPIIFLSALLITSCNKDTIKPNKEATEYFPNNIGNYWEYDVYDSNSRKQYNVTVNIIGIQKLIDNKDAYIWQYQYPWGNDTNYVRIVSDTVKIYDQFRIETLRGLEFPLKIFLIPFKDGQRWDGKLLAIDSSHVTAESITTSLGNFTNGFNIYHHYLGPNIESNDTYWFVPKIGMVKIYYNHYDFAPRTKVLWYLKKYYLQ